MLTAKLAVPLKPYKEKDLKLSRLKLRKLMSALDQINYLFINCLLRVAFIFNFIVRVFQFLIFNGDGVSLLCFCLKVI